VWIAADIEDSRQTDGGLICAGHGDHWPREKVPGTRLADDWSRAQAEEMHREGYSAGTIIGHLEAYGIGLYAAQALVRHLADRVDRWARRDSNLRPPAFEAVSLGYRQRLMPAFALDVRSRNRH
jgi:hypothetical protein